MPIFYVDPVIVLGLLVVGFPALWALGFAVQRILFGPEMATFWTRPRRRILALAAASAGVLLTLATAARPSVLTISLPERIRHWMMLAGLSRSVTMRWEFGVIAYAVQLLLIGVTVVLASVLAAKLLSKWMGGMVTEQERLWGAAGLNAWMTLANLACAAVITIGLYAGFGLEIGQSLMAAVGLLGALALYPLGIATDGAPPEPAMAPVGSVVGAEAPDRQRIMRLLEDGKVNAHEAAELLSALGDGASPAAPLTAGRRLLLIGLATVLVGFFLPWLVVNPGQELARAMPSIGLSSPQVGAMPPSRSPWGVSSPEIRTGDLAIRGGDIPHAMGWVVLVLSAVASLLPFAAPALEPSARRMMMFLSLAAGGVIIVYLFSDSWRWASYGLALVAGGYVLTTIGTAAERARNSASEPTRLQ